jgi:hypothetical protein
MAQRQGLALRKSRRRDPHALDFGQWYALRNGDVVKILDNSAEVEAYLTNLSGTGSSDLSANG